jgi:hypothetical protein
VAFVFQKGTARLEVPPLNAPLGTSHQMKVQGSLKSVTGSGLTAKETQQERPAVSFDQGIFQRQDALMGARITLPSAAAEQLPVNSFSVISAGGDDMKAAQGGDSFSQGDVGSTPGHVGCHRHLDLSTGHRDNFGLLLVLPGIQHPVNHPCSSQLPAQQFGIGDRRGSDQHRPSLISHLSR